MGRYCLYRPGYMWLITAFFLVLNITLIPAEARIKKNAVHYGAGLIVNIPLPEPEVEEVVEDISQNGIIRGTKEYNKDEYVDKAVGTTSSTVFPKWTTGGKVSYKVRTSVLDPRNFKDSGDVGTLAVRYVVQPQGDKNTVLRIDALFVEDFRKTVHTSDGSVESAEYKDIQDRLAAVELVKKETADALEAKKEHAAKEKFGVANANDTVSSSKPGQTSEAANRDSNSDGTEGQLQPATEAPSPVEASASNAPQPAAYSASGETLEQHVATLRRQVERLVKKPGAPLQSAPFHTATTLKSLDPGTDVLILITTPYWYGIETRDGQHGWIRRDMLEQLP
jgi:hypothetical protein